MSSMTVGEKAQFLIHPDLAFGELGSLDRIPPNATVMLIAEVLRLDNSPEEEFLSIEDRKDFQIVYKKAKILNFEANKHFKDGKIFQAVSIYRKAENLLLRCSLKSDEEENKFKRLLLKIYCNLAISYNSDKLNQPQKVCVAVRKAFEIDRANASKNPKLFYNRGVAHTKLSEYDLAQKDLRTARRLAPGAEDVKEQLDILDKRMKSYREFENAFSNKALGFAKSSVDGVSHSPDIIDDECKAAASRLLEDFKLGSTKILDLESEYEVAEREWLKAECDRLKLKYHETAMSHGKYDVKIRCDPQ